MGGPDLQAVLGLNIGRAGREAVCTPTPSSVNQITSGGAGYDTDGNQNTAPLGVGSCNNADQTVISGYALHTGC